MYAIYKNIGTAEDEKLVLCHTLDSNGNLKECKFRTLLEACGELLKWQKEFPDGNYGIGGWCEMR